MGDETTLAADGLLTFGDTSRGFASGQVVFQRYALQKLLGRGGMGIVWLARDQSLNNDVALKFLPQLLLHNRAALEDLKDEARNSMQLAHPHIIHTYGFVGDESSGCVSMEYVDGDTLQNLRHDRPNEVFEVKDLVIWTRQFCDAMTYAHETIKIVHRDLKPENLMVDRKGNLKIADFGISATIAKAAARRPT